MRQEAVVSCLISFPIDAMDSRIVEFIFYLTPGMVENVFTFFSRAIRELGFKVDIFRFAVFNLDLFQFAAGNEE